MDLKIKDNRFCWIPLVIGAICLAATLSLWQSLRFIERDHIRRSNEAAAESTKDQISNILNERMFALKRMASRWAVREETPREEWKEDARKFYEHQPGYQAIEWVDSDFHVRWIVPLKGNEAAQDLNLAFEERRRKALEEAKNKREITVSRPINLVQGGKGFLIYCPIYKGQNFAGFILGVFRFKELFDTILTNSNPGYSISIFEGEQEIYRRSEKHNLGSSFVTSNLPLHFHGVQWRIVTSPLPSQISEQQSSIPALTLAAGLCLSLLLTLVLYLAQTDRTRVRKLRDEMEGRRRVEGEYRRVIETANDAFISMDEEGNITEWNQQAEDIFGWTKEEATGRSLAEVIIPEESRPAHNAGVKRYLSTGEEKILNKRIELIALHRDGHTFPVELTVWRVEATSRTRFNAFVHDISERKSTEAELLDAKERAELGSRAKSTFLANMSHEIRTPMNGILGMTKLLQRSNLTLEQRKHTDTVRSSAESLLSIIDAILDLSQIEAGRMEIEVIPFDLKSTLDGVVDLLRTKAGEKEIQLNCRYPTDCPSKFLGDQGKIRQIITNLAGNAVKFTHEGQVSIDVEPLEVSEGELHFKVKVADTGIGVPSDKQAMIFQKFIQEDSSTRRSFGGTGLGLPISAELVRLLGGEIGLESSPGKGSMFWFTLRLPIHYKNTESQSVGTDQPTGASTSLETHFAAFVLVVEDNPVNQQVASGLLKNLGCSVDIANNGKEAVQMALTGRYDLIYMDCQLPEMDGYEATQQIRRLEGLASEVSIVALTANAMKGEWTRCLEAGMNDYISKPLDENDLIRTLALWSQSRELDRSQGLPDDQEEEASSPSTSPIDLDCWEQLRRIGKDDFIDRLASTFKQVMVDKTLQIASAVENSEPDKLAEAAHSLKGSALSIGAMPMASIAENLELSGRAASMQGTNDLLKALELEEERVRDTLKEMGVIA